MIRIGKERVEVLHLSADVGVQPPRRVSADTVRGEDIRPNLDHHVRVRRERRAPIISWAPRVVDLVAIRALELRRADEQEEPRQAGETVQSPHLQRVCQISAAAHNAPLNPRARPINYMYSDLTISMPEVFASAPGILRAEGQAFLAFNSACTCSACTCS